MARRGAGVDGGDRTEGDRVRAGGDQGDRPQVVQVAQPGVAAHQEVPAGTGEHTGHAAPVLAIDQAADGVDRQVEPRQIRRRQVDPERPPLAAQHLDRGDPVDPLEPARQVVAHGGPQGDRISRATVEHVGGDLLESRSEGLEPRHRALRQATLEPRQGGPDELPRVVDAGPPGELHGDLRDPLR